MFGQNNYWNYSQFEISDYSINFSSFMDPLNTASTTPRPQKRLTGLKLNTNQFEYNSGIDNLFNDSLINQNLSSIRKIDVMSDNVELTDLGESSILKFLNDVSNKKNQHKHKNPMTDMTINPMIEELDENFDEDEEEPEAYSSNILNSLSHSLRSGVVVKKRNMTGVIKQNDDSVFYNEFGVEDRNKIIVTEFIKKIFDDINNYNEKIYKSNFDQFSINDEIVDMINVYAKLEKMNKLLQFVNSHVENVVDIDNFNDYVIKQVVLILSKLISSSKNSRFQALHSYNTRLKRYQQLQRIYNIHKRYNDKNISIVDRLDAPVTDSLIQNVNFTVEVVLNNESEATHESGHINDSLALKDIEREYKYIEINQIVTNSLYLEMLTLFNNLVNFHDVASKNCIKYTTESSAKEKEFLLCENSSILFNFLKISEVLRNHEFIIKLHTVFGKLIKNSIIENNFDLFTFLIKSQINNYHKRLNRILPVDRSITPLNRMENNVWGKYTVSKLCVDEFEKMLDSVNIKEVLKEIKASPLVVNVDKSIIFSDEPDYTKFLDLKMIDEHSYTQWLQRYHDVFEKPQEKKRRFRFLRRLRNKWHGIKEENKVEESPKSKEVVVKQNHLSIFDIFGIEKTSEDDKYQSLYILTRHLKS